MCESNVLRTCPRTFVTASLGRGRARMTVQLHKSKLLQLHSILAKLSRKKHTSVRNGGIQRRSPKQGGVFAGLYIYEKVVTCKQMW